MRTAKITSPLSMSVELDIRVANTVLSHPFNLLSRQDISLVCIFSFFCANLNFKEVHEVCPLMCLL